MRKETAIPARRSTDYNPNRLLDVLLEKMQLQNDSALSRRLKVAKTVISNIRIGKIPVAASMMIWMHEATGISILELRELLGDRRMKFRPAYIVSR